MIQSLEQLPLGVRVQTLKAAVLATRARQEQDKQEEATYLDLLAKAESEVTGKAPGSEGVVLSGLIESNPYDPGAPPTRPGGTQGDLVDPNTGESAGGAAPGGRAPSPADRSQTQSS
jgi:hypothetical protein